MTIDRACCQMLEEDVKKFVEVYNRLEDGRAVIESDEMSYYSNRVLFTAVYAFGWRFNEESNKYEREENYS